LAVFLFVLRNQEKHGAVMLHCMSPFLADIVAKVPERRSESEFVQYSTLDRRSLESKMHVDSQIWNIFSHTDVKNLFATISAHLDIRS
jgi:hypothetical protein